MEAEDLLSLQHGKLLIVIIRQVFKKDNSVSAYDLHQILRKMFALVNVLSLATAPCIYTNEAHVSYKLNCAPTIRLFEIEKFPYKNEENRTCLNSPHRI